MSCGIESHQSANSLHEFINSWGVPLAQTFGLGLFNGFEMLKPKNKITEGMVNKLQISIFNSSTIHGPFAGVGVGMLKGMVLGQAVNRKPDTVNRKP